MRFDFCIGNPPYNDEFGSGDNKTFATPVYDKFMDATYTMAEKVELIHPARFLFNAGSTPKPWNEKMLKDEHFKILDYEEDCSKVFSNTEIKGGIAISYRDSSRVFGAIQVFTKHNEINSILQKTTKTSCESITSIMLNQNKFNLDALYEDYPELKHIIGSEGKDKRFRNNIFDKVPAFTISKQSEKDIAVLGVKRMQREWRYINSKYVDETHENLYTWKVLIGAASGAGKFGEALSQPIIIEPCQGYTQTYIAVGLFEKKEYADNLVKYIKSKFFRTLLGVLKITQHNDIGTFEYVPLQDFTSESDIDWSKSIHEIDLQLYKKYGLSQEEIDFIETNVKEME